MYDASLNTPKFLHLMRLLPQEKHGDVCPANWTEGAKTMKADPKASLEYFSTVETNGHSNGTTKKRPRVE